MRYPWEEQYLTALEETDLVRLPQLIAFAETAIYIRLRRLDEERQARQSSYLPRALRLVPRPRLR